LLDAFSSVGDALLSPVTIQLIIAIATVAAV
jgi:hypothetical protein